MTTKTGRFRLGSIVFGGILSFLVLLAPAFAAAQVDDNEKNEDRSGDGTTAAPFRLTLLHFGNSDSSLLDTDDQPGIGAFVAEVRSVRRGAERRGGVVLLGTGDYLAEGPVLAASLAHPERFYDAQALSRLAVDAYAVGAGDLAFGPDVFAQFVHGFNRRPVLGPFIGANLQAGTDAALAELVETGRLLPSAVITANDRGVDRDIGIVSVADATLNPAVTVGSGSFDPAVAEAAQRQIDQLTESGVDVVVLVSDLGTAEADRQLVAELQGVDVVLSASDANPEARVDLLLDRNAQIVVWGAAAGGYSELGRLVLMIDADGAVVGVEDAAPSEVDADGRSDLWTQRNMQRLRTELARFATDPIARTQVDLNGVRSDLRSGETNLGNLVADAVLWQGASYAARTDQSAPDISLVASELIASDAIYRVPELTMRDTFDIAGEAGNVVLLENVSREELQIVLEDAVSTMENVSGRFPQFAGFTVDIDLSAPARVATLVGGVEEAGSRIVNLTLVDGTAIISGGQVVPGDALTIATVDRLVIGDDRYQFTSLTPIAAGGPVRQALVQFLLDELDGAISLDRYPDGGEARLFAE